ncbi:MAG TPA: hypothetical protein VGG79_02245 [Roseiarcus sp.]|jgi:hypothetical protein
MTRRILHELKIDKIAAVDRPCQEAATMTLMKRSFTPAERERLADTGAAMDDGSFPIVTAQDLRNAIHALNRARDYSAVKSHIIARAQAIGAEDQLPDSWGLQKAAPAFAAQRQGVHEALTAIAKATAATTGETFEGAYSRLLMNSRELQRALS